jgi:predicted glutamine amidotransferase
MCIAILQPAGTRLTKQKAENSFDSNPHGAGYMYAHDGKLVVNKAFYTFKELWEALEPDLDQYAETCPFVIHMRIKTHGDNSPANIHPHIVNDDLAFVHNGIISIGTKGDESDTAAFNRVLLQDMPENFLKNKAIMRLIEDFCSGSKLVFLDSQGNFQIANERLGHWNKTDGLWYSNHSYEDYASYYGYKYGGSYKSSKKNATAGTRATSSTSGAATSTTSQEQYEAAMEEYEHGESMGWGEEPFDDDYFRTAHGDVVSFTDDETAIAEEYATKQTLEMEQSIFNNRRELGTLRDRIQVIADDSHDRCDYCGAYIPPYDARMFVGNDILCGMECAKELKQVLELP